MVDSAESPNFERKILGLDGVRGLAVIAVVLTHLGFYSYLSSHGLMPDQVLPMVHGGTGVYAFFVLSGLLITKLLIQEWKTTGSLSLRNFYARRALRIFPLYFLIVGIILALTLFGATKVHWASFFFAATYTYNFIPLAYYSGLLGHTWTLSVEEHFYLIWPAIFVWGISRKFGALQAVALIAIILSLVFSIAVGQTPLSEKFYPYRWTFVAGGYIAIGAGMALLLNHSIRSESWRRCFRSPLSLIVGFIMYGHTIFISLEQQGIGTHTRCLGICLIIAWIILNQRSLFTRALEFRPLRYVGKISYGIYMWQGLFLSTGPARIEGQGWPPSPWIGLVLLIIVAPASHAFIEKPFLRLKNRFSWKKAQKVGAYSASAQSSSNDR